MEQGRPRPDRAIPRHLDGGQERPLEALLDVGAVREDAPTGPPDGGTVLPEDSFPIDRHHRDSLPGMGRGERIVERGAGGLQNSVVGLGGAPVSASSGRGWWRRVSQGSGSSSGSWSRRRRRASAHSKVAGLLRLRLAMGNRFLAWASRRRWVIARRSWWPRGLSRAAARRWAASLTAAAKL